MKFSIPSVFNFDGELVDCNFNVKLERAENSPSLFKIEVGGHLDGKPTPRPFRGGSTVVVDPNESIAARVDVVIARVETLVPVELAPDCRLLLQDAMSLWLVTT